MARWIFDENWWRVDPLTFSDRRFDFRCPALRYSFVIPPIDDKVVVAGLVKKSNRILLRISTHKFPFDLFPDTITVDEERVTVIIRNFFMSSEVHSVDLKDVSNIFINMTPFFAQLVIVSKTFTENEIRIASLWKDEAIYLRRIVEGLRTFASENIDTSVYTQGELLIKLRALSTTEIVV